MNLRSVAPLAALAVLWTCSCSKKGNVNEAGPRRYAALETAATTPAAEAAALRADNAIKTVWVVAMENHDWDEIEGSASAPYINGTLLKQGAHATRYRGTSRPSEPNYIWMEAGDDLQIADNDDPAENHRTTRRHLVSLLERGGSTWRSYQDGIDGKTCPLTSVRKYRPKHNPMIYFDDVTEGVSATSRHCIEHVRPVEELEGDLRTGHVASYNFITPDLCHDMHDTVGCETPDSIRNGDNWLAQLIPRIQATREYQEGGAIFVVWDESEGSDDAPIGLIALSPFVKPGYTGSTVAYDHASLLRTQQEIFEVRPLIRAAADAHSLSDLFARFP